MNSSWLSAGDISLMAARENVKRKVKRPDYQSIRSISAGIVSDFLMWGEQPRRRPTLQIGARFDRRKSFPPCDDFPRLSFFLLPKDSFLMTQAGETWWRHVSPVALAVGREERGSEIAWRLTQSSGGLHVFMVPITSLHLLWPWPYPLAAGVLFPARHRC